MKKKVVGNNGHEYVDLGLPSGRLWATCNVGASTPTETGDYFMWGSTKPNNNTDCNWNHTPFNNHKDYFDSDFFNSHNEEWLDGDILKKERDIANITMGGDWRMPTKEDFEELLNHTTSEWVENYQGSGVNGRLFTSKTNGNNIFIPTAGRRWGGSFEFLEEGSSIAYLWSSSLRCDRPSNAWLLVSYLNGADSDVSGYRNYGFSVRGVL